MFIHIGDDQVIRSEEVIAIIDTQLVSTSIINEELLHDQKSSKQVKEPSINQAKSLVITKEQIYHSPLSVLTLKKRASMMTSISKLENYTDLFQEE